jgi:hypothetical protein
MATNQVFRLGFTHTFPLPKRISLIVTPPFSGKRIAFARHGKYVLHRAKEPKNNRR